MTGRPAPPHNRLEPFWRPLVDMGASDLAPVRLRLIRPVNEWLDETSDRWSWCSRVSVPGLRHQVIRHAGLAGYEARTPSELPPERRTPAWRTLVRSIERMDALDWRRRSLVVVQLAQLSYHRLALDLADLDRPSDGSAAHQRFRYDLAKVAVVTPGLRDRALAVFRELAEHAEDPVVRLASAFQGIGHTLHGGLDLTVGWRFERTGRSVFPAVPAAEDDWEAALVRSRFHRAVALLSAAGPDRARAADEADLAESCHAEVVSSGGRDAADELIALENERYLVEMRLRLALGVEPADHDEVTALCGRLIALDPYCVQARSTVGDAYLAIGHVEQAARWYEHAGELATGAGAVAWYRAGQCHLALGDGGAARHAMGRCLELDATAVEPRELLEAD
ncbi:tetratricopeptide repeat protein [Actinosynnema sp. NPDC049800]